MTSPNIHTTLTDIPDDVLYEMIEKFINSPRDYFCLLRLNKRINVVSSSLKLKELKKKEFTTSWKQTMPELVKCYSVLPNKILHGPFIITKLIGTLKCVNYDMGIKHGDESSIHEGVVCHTVSWYRGKKHGLETCSCFNGFIFCKTKGKSSYKINWEHGKKHGVEDVMTKQRHVITQYNNGVKHGPQQILYKIYQGTEILYKILNWDKGVKISADYFTGNKISFRKIY